MVFVWLIGCVLLAAALPAAILLSNRIAALIATLAVAGAWYGMLTSAPDIGFSGGLLVLGLLFLTVVGALVALIIRVREAMGSGYVR